MPAISQDQQTIRDAGLLNSGFSVVLQLPTGGGKTLAGFLPSLVDLAARPLRKPRAQKNGVHTLYVSPLKALNNDIHRNLRVPLAGIRAKADDLGLDAAAIGCHHVAPASERRVATLRQIGRASCRERV